MTLTSDTRGKPCQRADNTSHPIRLLDRDAKGDWNHSRPQKRAHKLVQPPHRDADVLEDKSAQSHNDGVSHNADMAKNRSMDAPQCDLMHLRYPEDLLLGGTRVDVGSGHGLVASRLPRSVDSPVDIVCQDTACGNDFCRSSRRHSQEEKDLWRWDQTLP
jgi:hypothetical protein